MSNVTGSTVPPLASRRRRDATAERLRRTFTQVRDIVLDPEPPMPKLFPARLSAADVRDVSAFVETL